MAIVYRSTPAISAPLSAPPQFALITWQATVALFLPRKLIFCPPASSQAGPWAHLKQNIGWVDGDWLGYAQPRETPEQGHSEVIFASKNGPRQKPRS
jgi:hypothetical protein